MGYVDLDPIDPLKVLRVSVEPVLDVGVQGAFDDNGVIGASIISTSDGRLFMYYVGFELCHHIRYRLLTGLAVSSNGGASFQRVQQTPILERSDKELFFRCGPFAMLDGGVFKLWYVAGSQWTEIDGRDMPVYTIKYLESSDGINWGREGRVCIDLTDDQEYGFGRPYVIKDCGIYKMFYSIRVKHKGYRLGYAESTDGMDWIRKDDEIGIDVSETGWDSQMICYSAVVRVKDSLYMFYNGNNFGETGFGWALLDQ
jgi:predicted GH43/DUF377 family glycosyl hydrolase